MPRRLRRVAQSPRHWHCRAVFNSGRYGHYPARCGHQRSFRRRSRGDAGGGPRTSGALPGHRHRDGHRHAATATQIPTLPDRGAVQAHRVAAALRNPAVVALAEHADDLVASFDYVDPRAGLLHHDDQGTYDRSYELTVVFDPAKVDAALAQLGLAVGAPRPLLNPIVLVRDRDPTPFRLSASEPRGRRCGRPWSGSRASWGSGPGSRRTPISTRGQSARSGSQLR